MQPKRGLIVSYNRDPPVDENLQIDGSTTVPISHAHGGRGSTTPNKGPNPKSEETQTGFSEQEAAH